MALIMSVSSLTAFAASDSTVTLTSDSKLEYQGNEVNKSVAPGETFTETITLVNANTHTADFYMSTEVAKALEEAKENAKGAGYDVVLKVVNPTGTTTLYDSAVGGKDSQTGLKEVSLQDAMLISTLKAGQTADVVLSIYFDGEGFDSTTATNYANAIANINFGFQAGYEAPTGNTVEYKTVTQKREAKNIILTGTAAKTGDSYVIPVVLGIVLIVGVALLIFGKKKNRTIKALLIAGCATAVLLGTNTKALAEDLPLENTEITETTKSYTVTFRPGAVGSFGIADASGNDLSGNDYAKSYDSAAKYSEATGAITVTVPANSSMPTAPLVIADADYVENTAWRADLLAENAKVTKDMDFVVDYSRLINGVEYTIEYVDAATGVSVYPAYTTRGNVGDEVTLTLPTVITISDAARYYPVSGQKVKVTLEAKDVSGNNPNVFVLKYNMEARTTSEDVTTVYIEGDTIYTIIPGAAPATAVNPTAPANAAEETPENTAEVTEPANGEVTIGDNETPLANGDGSDTTTVDITDEPTPEAAANAVLWPYFLGVGIVIAALLAFLFVAMKKKQAVAAAGSSDDDKEN